MNEPKRAREIDPNELARAVFADSCIAIEVTDMDGYIAGSNPAYQELVGRTHDELVTMRYSDITHQEDSELDLALWNELLAGNLPRYQVEKRFIHKDGSEIAVRIHVSLVRDEAGTPLFAIGVIDDITKWRKLEDFRARFIADAAHELRGPVAALTGFAEILGKQWRELTDEQRHNSFAALERQGARLRELTQALLDLGRIESEPDPELRSVQLGEIARLAVDAAPPPEGKKVEILMEEDLYALAEGRRLQQVIVNLLTNAYRYGGRSITVGAERKPGEVTLVVQDDGPGVPSATKPHLFDPFVRGQNSANVQGSGLGLAIVNSLITAMRGSIQVSDADPHGARFEVTLLSPAAPTTDVVDMGTKPL